MGCTQTKEAKVDTRPLAIRYAAANLNQPFSTDYQNNFEKEIFYAVNMLRVNPRSFVPHV